MPLPNDVATEVYRTFSEGARSAGGEREIAQLLGRHPELATELAALHEQAIEDLYIELFERRRAGEPVDLDFFCAEHPAQADGLRDAIRDARKLERAEQEIAAAVEGPDPLTEAQNDPALARYVLRRSIGRGGMGEVYLAWDTVLRRYVALKLMAASAASPDLRARFQEEAQVTSQLDHPGFVPVHDLGFTASGRPFMSMKLIKGDPLDRIIRRVHEGKRGYDTARVVRDLVRVCEALDYAHQKQVVHRDLKPSNVMVGRYGSVYVVDWGLSRTFGEAGDEVELEGGLRTRVAESVRGDDGDEMLATQPGAALGSIYYMAPEQGSAEGVVDTRSDIYSLGAILYYVLARKRPYDGGATSPTRAVFAAQLALGPPLPLDKIAPDAPLALVRVAQRAMQRDPEARYRTMGELARALEAALVEPAQPPPAAPVPPAQPVTRRRRRLGGAELALLGALLFVLGLWVGRWLAAS